MQFFSAGGRKGFQILVLLFVRIRGNQNRHAEMRRNTMQSVIKVENFQISVYIIHLNSVIILRINYENGLNNNVANILLGPCIY